MAVLTQLVVDSREPAVLARFWAAALDDFEIRAYDDDEIARLESVGRTPDTDPCVILDGPGIEICFQEVEVHAASKRPMHVDIASTKRDAETAQLVLARRVDRRAIRRAHMDARSRGKRLLRHRRLDGNP